MRRMVQDGRDTERIARGLAMTRDIYGEYDYRRMDVKRLTVWETVEAVVKTSPAAYGRVAKIHQETLDGAIRA